MVTTKLNNDHSVIIGVDVGNSDIKSANTVLPNGYISSLVEPKMCSSYLKYNNMYYVRTENRFHYLQDKTINDNCFITTLMSIANEIISFFKSNNPELTDDELQNQIDAIQIVHLASGLPPAHMFLSEKYQNYYKKKFGSKTSFSYNGFRFDFRLGKCGVFPQDYAATYKNSRCDKIREYGTFYAADIGGYTADVIRFTNGSVDVSFCYSKELGILKMIANIISRVQTEYGITLDNSNILNILAGKKTTLSPDIVNYITLAVKDHANLILNTFRELGLEYKAYPCIFLGGASMTFKPYIKRSPIIGVTEFISDISANAKGYERIMQDLIYG